VTPWTTSAAAWVSRADEAAVRNTPDVDLLLQREDLPAAIAGLEKAGFIHRRSSQSGSLGQTGTMDIFLEGPTGKVRDAVHIVFAAEKNAARPTRTQRRCRRNRGHRSLPPHFPGGSCPHEA